MILNSEKLNIQMDFMKDLLKLVQLRRMGSEGKFIIMKFMRVNSKILRKTDGAEKLVLLESIKKENLEMDICLKVKDMMKVVMLSLIKS